MWLGSLTLAAKVCMTTTAAALIDSDAGAVCPEAGGAVEGAVTASAVGAGVWTSDASWGGRSCRQVRTDIKAPLWPPGLNLRQAIAAQLTLT